MGTGLKTLFVWLFPEGDVYQAQTPNVETHEAPEVKEDEHVQVEVPEGQVGSGNHAAVRTAFLILLPGPLPACGPSLPLPPKGSYAPSASCCSSFRSYIRHFPAASFPTEASVIGTINSRHSV